MKSLLRTMAVVLFVACAATTAAFASDVYSPSWRGTAGSDVYSWTFDDDASPAVVTSEGGRIGTANIFPETFFGMGWNESLPGFGTKTGLWDLGSEGIIEIAIGQIPTDISVEITYFKDLTQAPTINVLGATLVSQQKTLVEEDPISGAWWTSQTVWHMDPDSMFDGIQIVSHTWGSTIDDITIDALGDATVPEPASICVLLTGCSAVLALRRRKF